MTRASFTLGVAFLATGITGGCAHFWTMPGEPLTTEEVCARAQDVHLRSAPGGVGYRSTVAKDRLTIQALYDQAMVDRQAAPGFISQARSIQSRSNDGWSTSQFTPRASDNYWSVQCRKAREQEERAG